MSATMEMSRPQLYTIGEVRRMVERSETTIRRLEVRGVVMPLKGDHRSTRRR